MVRWHRSWLQNLRHPTARIRWFIWARHRYASHNDPHEKEILSYRCCCMFCYLECICILRYYAMNLFMKKFTFRLRSLITVLSAICSRWMCSLCNECWTTTTMKCVQSSKTWWRLTCSSRRTTYLWRRSASWHKLGCRSFVTRAFGACETSLGTIPTEFLQPTRYACSSDLASFFSNAKVSWRFKIQFKNSLTVFVPTPQAFLIRKAASWSKIFLWDEICIYRFDYHINCLDASTMRRSR